MGNAISTAMRFAPLSSLAVLVACGGMGPGDRIATLPSAIRGFALDSSGLYATTADNSVYRIPLDGGAPKLLQTIGANAFAYGAAPVLTATEVVWADSVTGTITATLKDGSSSRTIASGASPAALAIDDQRVYWTSRTPAPDDVTSIRSARIDGSAPVLLASLPHASVPRLAVDSERIYFVQDDVSGTSSIQSMRKDGTDQRVDVAPPPASAFLTGFSLWQGGLYWSSGGQVHRLDLASQTSVDLDQVDGIIEWLGADARGVLALAEKCVDHTDQSGDVYQQCSNRAYAGASRIAAADAQYYLSPGLMNGAFDSQWLYWAPPRSLQEFGHAPVEGDVFRVHR